mmetsp:Transcript_1079/g.880  ORF Transcript_1079/g.880 Transcript_1079/m.880 type:complete len:285 (+) Transcript_1079:17-871(+)
MALEDDWEVSDEDANWDTEEETTIVTTVTRTNDQYSQTAHNGSDTAGFWQWLYLDNTDQPTFSRKSNNFGESHEDQLQFDPTGLSPIIEHWLKRIFGKNVLYLFPASVQQIIIYFVLHFQFQVNNPCVSSNADLIKYEFRAWSNHSYFGTILFGKAFPSSVLFKYECYVRVDTVGRGIGVGIVPFDFNTFLHEHEYFPHYKTNTCMIFENGHYFGWDGTKQDTEFKIKNGDVLVIEMDMKKRTMSLKQFGGDLSFVIEKLPDNSKLAFVLDSADITVTSQCWKL